MALEPERQVPDPQPQIPRVDLWRFPERARHLDPRPVYFGALHPEDRAELQARGYHPQTLMELPRGTPVDEERYLLAKAQAIEELTFPGLKIPTVALELQMKANRMLEKGANVRVNVKMGSGDVMHLLQSWGNSRHTLRGNTTIQEAQQGFKEGPAEPAKKKKGKKK